MKHRGLGVGFIALVLGFATALLHASILVVSPLMERQTRSIRVRRAVAPDLNCIVAEVGEGLPELTHNRLNPAPNFHPNSHRWRARPRSTQS
jgi:hypothetical protein